jgi:hypothetical protein
MKREEVWLNLPQAVVFAATHDIEAALRLSDDNPDLLMLNANRVLSRQASVPLEEDAPEAERRDAFARLQEELYVSRTPSRYLAAESRVWGLLARGVTASATKRRGGSLEKVDPAEFTRLQPKGVDAIDRSSGEVVLFDLRIDAFDLLEKLKAPPGDTSPTDQPQEADPSASLRTRIRSCSGDRLPLVVEWASEKYGDETLPPRETMLKDFRADLGPLLGVNEKTMREVRRQLVTGKALRGGAPTHRRFVAP